MAHALRFLAQTLPNVSWTELLDRYKYIEDLGFDLVGVGRSFRGLEQSTKSLVRVMDPHGGDCLGD